MAVGLKAPGTLIPVPGIELGIAEAGIRYQGRPDLVLMTLAKGSTASAVFTQSKCCAAPVTLAKQHLHETSPRALLINAGNANAVTGEQGMQNAIECCAAVARQLGLSENEVLPFSTGVIGEQLNMPAMLDGVKKISQGLSDDNWLPAAEAIMTTDTVAKAVSRQIELNGELVTITGIAKGSGMICPDMATMLAYVTTDAGIPQPLLDTLLQRGVEASFNRITVDSDTSTNDALVLVATGQSEVKIESYDHEYIASFYDELECVLVELATAIIRDAEGASKFVKIVVNAAADLSDAKAVAYSIAHSPLVKTALFASDPNWGRILMALGKAPARHLLMEKVDIKIADVDLIESGEPVASYTEAQGQAVFERDEITITINLNVGDIGFHVWTSDLSHGYVSINADYRS